MGKGLGSTAAQHARRADAALAQAKRFLKLSSAVTRNCEVRLNNAMLAREFSSLAVSEAANAAGNKRGPTRQQSKASRVADKAIDAWQRALIKCSR